MTQAHVYLTCDWPVSPVSHSTLWCTPWMTGGVGQAVKETDTAGQPVTASKNLMDFFDRPPADAAVHRDLSRYARYRQCTTVYHGAPRFITDCKPLTHHRTLYYSGQLVFIIHMQTFTNPPLPTYLSSYMLRKQCSHSLHSQAFITFSVQYIQSSSNRHYLTLPLQPGTHYSRIWSRPAWPHSGISNIF